MVCDTTVIENYTPWRLSELKDKDGNFIFDDIVVEDSDYEDEDEYYDNKDYYDDEDK